MKPDFSNKNVSSSNGTLQRQSSSPTNVLNLSGELHKTSTLNVKLPDYPVCRWWSYVVFPFSEIYCKLFIWCLKDSLLLRDISPQLPYNSHITVLATFNRQQNIQKYFFHSTGTVSWEATQTNALLVNLTPVARSEFVFLHTTLDLNVIDKEIKPLCHMAHIWNLWISQVMVIYYQTRRLKCCVRRVIRKCYVRSLLVVINWFECQHKGEGKQKTVTTWRFFALFLSAANIGIVKRVKLIIK